MNQAEVRMRKRAELKRRKIAARKKEVFRLRCILASFLFIMILVLGFMMKLLFFHEAKETVSGRTGENNMIWSESSVDKPMITEHFLTLNEYSRPGEKIEEVNNIFVHYTANPGTSAEQNRSYFESLAETKVTSASAHFVIGYEGEIVQCIPLDEIGYAVQTRNYDSISIECCYIDESGKFTDETYESLLKLTRWLMQEYDLDSDDVLRHYDQNGKLCPIYYVENEEAWEAFKNDL